MINPSLNSKPLLEFKKSKITAKAYKKYISYEHDNSPKDADLTISIVCYNEGDTVLNLVDNLLKIDKDNKSRIVLVDNGLDEATAKSLARKKIHYIKATHNLGPSLGRNLVASVANTSLMAILDADAQIEEDYIDACIEIMQDTDIVCARGKVIPLSTSSRQPKLYDYGDSTFPCPPVTEGISVWRTDDFMKAGGFEESVYGGEGIILCYRMIELYNYRYDQFIYTPRLVLRHDYNSSLEQLSKKHRRNLISRWHIDRRYPLLESVLREFNEISKSKRKNTGKRDSIRVNSLLGKLRKDFDNDLENLRLSNIKRRWTMPDRVNKGEKYKFAVVLPCYNLGYLVEDAVKSVMGQTLDSIQIIVVDDKSTDPDTRAVLKSLESHVEVIYRKENGGASAARNTGVAASNADYVLCLDSDDTISPTYLEEAYNIFEMDEKVGVVGSYVELVGERVGKWKPMDKVTVKDALTSSPIANASCFRKKAWESVGGYDENLRGKEDWEYWISLLKYGWPVRIIPRYHYIYLTRPNSKVKTSNKNAESIVSYIMDKHEDVYKEHFRYAFIKKYKEHIEVRDRLHYTQKKLRLLEERYGKIAKGVSLLERKLKRAREVVSEEKDPKLFMRLVEKNIRTVKSRIIKNG